MVAFQAEQLAFAAFVASVASGPVAFVASSVVAAEGSFVGPVAAVERLADLATQNSEGCFDLVEFGLVAVGSYNTNVAKYKLRRLPFLRLLILPL